MKRCTVYVCGTAPSEFDPKNSGPVEVYMSPEALLDDLECGLDCGVIECEIVVGANVVVGKHTSGLTGEEADRLEREEEVLVERMFAAVHGENPDTLYRAVERLRGKIHRERVRKRREERLRRETKVRAALRLLRNGSE